MIDAGDILRGLVFGSLAALNSLGIVLLWRTSRVVNLAQPAMGLVGGVLTGLLVVSARWNFFLALPVGLAVGAALGLASDRLVLRRLRDAPRAVLLVATVALAQVFAAMQTALPFAFGGKLPTYSLDLGITITIGRKVFLGSDLLVLVSLPLALAGTLWFLYRSRFGISALALGQDTERAQALGVPAAAVRSAVWAVAGVLSTISGVLAIPVQGFGLTGRIGPTVILLALAPAVFAGLRSLTGTAAAALALGIAYQGMLAITHDGPESELIIAGAVILALALQGRRLGRSETAARASSWEAAATPRPLPWSVAQSSGFRTIGSLFGILAVGAVIFPPQFLSPGQDSLYAGTSAFALAGLAVAAAWMFAGEVVLGHWGVAGLAGLMTVHLGGPWPLRCAVATIAAAGASAVLGFASRRRSSLSFAVIGLAVASAASIGAVLSGDRVIGVDPATVGPFTAAFTVAAAIGLTRFRSSRLGMRLVAARDDPDRAPWLGVDPVRARVIALTISGALVGLAGSLYVVSSSIGISSGAFEPFRSLELLAMVVIGGLGSPAGALIGIGLVTASQFLLPTWGDLLASGIGVLLVLIFLPGGLGRAITAIRDLVARPFASSQQRSEPVTQADREPAKV